MTNWHYTNHYTVGAAETAPEADARNCLRGSAWGGSRTLTALRPAVFETAAYAGSATQASGISLAPNALRVHASAC